MESGQKQKIIFITAEKIFRPLVRIFLRNGISYKSMSDLLKQIFVDVADEEFSLPHKKQTTARISTITGLSRKEVLKQKQLSGYKVQGWYDQYHRVTKVINAWISNKKYLDKNDEPIVLPLVSGEASFTSLVKETSGDIPTRAILDELINVGTVSFSNDHIHLLQRAYIPNYDNNEKIKILGSDVSDLINTIDHNMTASLGNLFFQRKVCYDNLPKEVLPKLRKILVKKGQNALESMNKDLAAYDRDSSKNVDGIERHRAGIGIHYFESEIIKKKE